MWGRSLRLGAVLAWIGLVAVGCEKIEAVDLGQQVGLLTIEAERLRPDMRPLSSGADQLPISMRPNYSDGALYDAAGKLIPEPNGSSPIDPLIFRDIAGPLTQQLRRADCLWIDEGNESARVSYEVIAYDLRVDDDLVLPEASLCGGFVHDPTTRGKITVMTEDEEVLIADFAHAKFDVALTRYEGAFENDPYHSCDAGDGDLSSLPKVERVLRGASALQSGFAMLTKRTDYPTCLIEGAIGRFDVDTSLQLEIVDLKTGEPLANAGINAPAFEIPTRVKIVEKSGNGSEFLLARPIEFVGTGDLENDAALTTTPILWTWSVEDGARGGWRENFSPNLNISRIRVFVAGDYDPDTGENERIYLDPRRVRAYTNYNDENGFRDRVLSCRFEDGNGESIPSCNDVNRFTPTYQTVSLGGVDTLSDRLTWEVIFEEVVERQAIVLPDGTMGFEDVVVQESPVRPGDPVFIEFHMVRPNHGVSANGLSVSPPVADVGDFRVASAPSFGNLFRVENFGQGNLQILSIKLEGPDAAAFKFSRLPRLPSTLRPGGQLTLALQAAAGSQHFGRREARVRIRARDASGQIADVYAALLGNAVDWIFDTLHGNFFFLRDATQQPWNHYVDEWQKPFLIINNGSAPMPRGQITITGPDATQFSVVRRTSEYVAASNYIPWVNGEQPPASITLEPGGSEFLFVLYHPKSNGVRTLSSGPDEAEIRVRVGDVDYATSVSGWCLGTCQFSGPAPAGAPSGGGAVVVWPGAAPVPSGGVTEPNQSLLLDR